MEGTPTGTLPSVRVQPHRQRLRRLPRMRKQGDGMKRLRSLLWLIRGTETKDGEVREVLAHNGAVDSYFNRWTTPRQNWLVFQIRKLPMIYERMAGPGEEFSRPSGYETQFVLPFWLLAAAAAVQPTIWFARHRRSRIAASRIDRQLCPTCGYDLRATPQRCPECGAVASK